MIQGQDSPAFQLSPTSVLALRGRRPWRSLSPGSSLASPPGVAGRLPSREACKEAHEEDVGSCPAAESQLWPHTKSQIFL